MTDILKYEIVKQICLTFLTHNDSVMELLSPNIGVHLEFKNNTIWAGNPRKNLRVEAMETGNLIGIMEKRGDIKRVEF